MMEDITCAPSGSRVIVEALRSLSEREPSLIESHAAKYSLSYLALRSLIRDRTDTNDTQQLLSAGYAVYGWMPTILKAVGDLEQLSRFIAIVKDLPTVEAIARARNLLCSDQSSALYCLNRSVVGTSKLLHFSLPQVFPIWDSRIAGLFRHKWQSHNEPIAYRNYFNAIHEYCGTHDRVNVPFFELLQNSAPQNDPLSHIRIVEYALFLEGSIRNVRTPLLENEQVDQ
jgi:hypothetical protein